MPKFSYKVRDREDRVVLGTMEAPSADDVLDRLSQGDLLPILVQEITAGQGGTAAKGLQEAFTFRRRADKVPYKTVVFFTRQLATMVGQGVPLSRCLEQLQMGEKPVFQRIVKQVADDISTGLTLSDAIARHPGAFSPMYVAVTHSGEVAGALDKVLDGMATYMENVEIMRGKVKTAMRYPVFILGIISLMMIAILWWLVPTFEKIYTSLGANLPVPTRILLFVSGMVRENTAVCIGLVILMVIAWKFAMTKQPFQILVDQYLLKTPIFGPIMQKNIWANYSRTMSLLMGAGTPILKATEIASATVSNKYFTTRLESIFGSLRKGELLSESLAASTLFPPLVVQLVNTGEASGKVDELLGKAAEFYEREIRNVVDSLSSIIEPILIILLGGVVGSVLFALYMPIFKIGEYIK